MAKPNTITPEKVLEAVKACKDVGFNDLGELAACLAFAAVKMQPTFSKKADVSSMVMNAMTDALSE